MKTWFAGVKRLQDVGGGCINRCSKVRLADGRLAFLKENTGMQADFFSAEAAGLRALAEAGSIVPGVIECGSDYLLLDWIETARPADDALRITGEMLAAQHDHHGPTFGFPADNYCGETRQINTRTKNGHEFFARCRLLPQGQWAFDAGKLDGPALKRLEHLCNRLPELIPEQPPSLIHGDLWTGNLMFAADGKPVLVDPAASWSWAEADLAMTRLFGGFGPSFHRAYTAARPLEPGFEDRVVVYNLYHLLNHLNLFGGAYHSDVMAVLRAF